MIHSKKIIYAPNIYTGGGLILLQLILDECRYQSSMIAILDERAKEHLSIPDDLKVSWCDPKLTSRFIAECKLLRIAKGNLRILCFHGLPPLLPFNFKVTVFLQNRLLITNDSLKQFKWKTRVRIKMERLLCKAFRYRVERYIVQTPTMKRDLLAWLGQSYTEQNVTVIPFSGDMHSFSDSNQAVKCFDFVYVADGEAHKNHRNLVAAWQLLAQDGIKPTLGLTLGNRDAELIKIIEEIKTDSDIKIINVGHLTHQQVADLYNSTHALIFPSLIESFGLPLIEAKNIGISILAPELDYVRDVCEPVQTFDPMSPVSIARAVKRYLGITHKPLEIRSAVDFFSEVFFESKK